MITAAAANSTDYLFLTGKVRALENRMLDKFRFYRLADNAEKKTFFEDLADSPYKDYLSENKFGLRLKEYIYDQYLSLRNKMEEPAYLDLFMVGSDISNIVSFLRGASDESEYADGVLEEKWWQQERMPEFVKLVFDRLKKMSEAEDISIMPASAVESACVDVVGVVILPNIKSDFALEYWKRSIDIKNFLLNKKGASKYYLSGGFISKNFWMRQDPSGEPAAKVEACPFYSRMEMHEDIADAEFAARQWKSGIIKEMRKIAFGPEPVIAYLLSIMEEAANLLHIYTGISMGFAPADLKEGLNLAYVSRV